MRSKIYSPNSISLDLTALCDVAFIILFFFLTTGRFVDTENPIIVKLPHSASPTCTLLNSNSILSITVSNNEKIFFTISNKFVEKEVLKNVKHNLSTYQYPAEINFQQLSTLLKLYSLSNKKIYSHSNSVILVGDEETSSAKIKQIIDVFQENGINKFSLLTEYKKLNKDVIICRKIKSKLI